MNLSVNWYFGACVEVANTLIRWLVRHIRWVYNNVICKIDSKITNIKFYTSTLSITQKKNLVSIHYLLCMHEAYASDHPKYSIYIYEHKLFTVLALIIFSSVLLVLVAQLLLLLHLFSTLTGPISSALPVHDTM